MHEEYDLSPDELRVEPKHYCPKCGYPYDPEIGCECGYGDDEVPVCGKCGGAIAEDGTCQDCNTYYPEYNQE